MISIKLQFPRWLTVAPPPRAPQNYDSDNEVAEASQNLPFSQLIR